MFSYCIVIVHDCTWLYIHASRSSKNWSGRKQSVTLKTGKPKIWSCITMFPAKIAHFHVCSLFIPFHPLFLYIFWQPNTPPLKKLALCFPLDARGQLFVFGGSDKAAIASWLWHRSSHIKSVDLWHIVGISYKSWLEPLWKNRGSLPLTVKKQIMKRLDGMLPGPGSSCGHVWPRGPHCTLQRRSVACNKQSAMIQTAVISTQKHKHTTAWCPWFSQRHESISARTIYMTYTITHTHVT